MSEEAHRTFACFGGTATVHVRGDGKADGEEAADRARRTLLDAHNRLSRFLEDSELTLLNRDPRGVVPASSLLRQVAATVRRAGMLSGGLVDATLLRELEGAGYRNSMEEVDGTPSSRSADVAGRRPARPHPARRWREIHVDEAAGTIARPPGLAIDSGGIAKGLVADLVGAELDGRRAYAVDCCGDIRIGGTAGLERTVLVGDPFGGDPIHELSPERRRDRDDRHSAPALDRPRWRGGPSPPRSTQRRAGLHRHRPGDGDRALGRARRGIREGGASLRPGRRRRLASARRGDRGRRRGRRAGRSGPATAGDGGGAVNAAPHLFWITSRAAGGAALLLASASVALGLMMGSRLKVVDKRDLRAVHEALSLTTLAMVTLHGVSLLGDSFLNPGLGGIAVPFAGAYRPLWTGLGIVAGYGLAALGLTYYVRDRIGAARWRKVHRLTAVFWLLAVAHTIGAGSDSAQLWFLAAGGALVLPAFALLLLRWLGRAEEAGRTELPTGPTSLESG